MVQKDIKKTGELYQKMREAISAVFIGQNELVDKALIALFAGGHVLLEGVPGVGKTVLVRLFSQLLGLRFGRVQFTPDLMPSDIIGSTVYDMKSGKFVVRKGPVFCDFLLADEINRAPAKTQSALLQAMQEREVTISGKTFDLGGNFLCFATQNPVELEGTYPLAEAQLDRFFMKIAVPHLPHEEECFLLRQYRDGVISDEVSALSIKKVCTVTQLNAARKIVDSVTVDDSVVSYISSICAATREHRGIEMGISPRGAMALLKAARVRAAVLGKLFVTPDDVREMAHPVLRHRLGLDPEFEIDGYTPDSMLEQVISGVKVPR